MLGLSAIANMADLTHMLLRSYQSPSYAWIRTEGIIKQNFPSYHTHNQKLRRHRISTHISLVKTLSMITPNCEAVREIRKRLFCQEYCCPNRLVKKRRRRKWIWSTQLAASVTTPNIWPYVDADSHTSIDALHHSSHIFMVCRGQELSWIHLELQ